MRVAPTATHVMLTVAITLTAAAASAPDSTASGPDFRLAANQLTVLLGEPDTALAPGLSQLVHTRVDVESLTQRAFGEYLKKSLDDYDNVLSAESMEGLLSRHRRRLADALQQRLLDDLGALLRQGSVRAVHVLDERLKGDHGEVDLLVLAPGAQIDVRGIIARRDDGWKFVDLVVDGLLLSRRYRQENRGIIAKRLSPPVLVAALRQQPFVILDDFADTEIGELPLDWGAWREKDQKKPMLYRVEADGGAPYLAAVDSGQSVILGKFVHWNPREYPIMTWCWRADALPAGADESRTELNDSAAGLYVFFSQNWLGVPKQLKYVWSSSLPTGTMGRRNMLFRPWFFVMESGTENLGKWVFEQVDLAAHHELKLGGRAPGRTIGLGILTDANSTNTLAEAGYADIRVWTREALEAGLIRNYCNCWGSPPLAEDRAE